MTSILLGIVYFSLMTDPTEPLAISTGHSLLSQECPVTKIPLCPPSLPSSTSLPLHTPLLSQTDVQVNSSSVHQGASLTSLHARWGLPWGLLADSHGCCNGGCLLVAMGAAMGAACWLPWGLPWGLPAGSHGGCNGDCLLVAMGAACWLPWGLPADCNLSTFSIEQCPILSLLQYTCQKHDQSTYTCNQHTA